MPDQVTSWIRTVWPGVVAYVTALLVTWIGQHVGITVNTNVVFGLVSLALLGIVYGFGRWLEGRSSPAAQRLGRGLLSLGLDLGQPTYKPPTPDSAGAHRLE